MLMLVVSRLQPLALPIMASSSDSKSGSSSAFLGVENEVNDTSNARKQRRKKFLWNSLVSFRSRRKWRTKKSKLADEDGEANKDRHHAPHHPPDDYDLSGCSGDFFFVAGSSNENDAANSLPECRFSVSPGEA